MPLLRRFKNRAYLLLPALLLGSALCLSLESSVSRAQPVDGTQTLVFLRHAEKFGKAQYVFAANPTRNVEEGELDNSYSYIRPLMTISPSAIKLGLPVNIDFAANDTSDLADELLHDRYHNSIIYTAWSHGYLPELINKVAEEAVGQRRPITEDWASSDFDSLYVLTLTWRNGKASLHSQSYKQGLDGGEQDCPS